MMCKWLEDMVLNDGNIAEMKTGEGKTLVATLAVVLNAMTGKGVHVVTVNDYLAKRDSEEMGKLYEFLGYSVGCLTANIHDEMSEKLNILQISLMVQITNMVLTTFVTT